MQGPDLTKLFIKEAKQAIPIHLVTEESWQAGPQERGMVTGLARSQNFSGKAGQVLTVPDKISGDIKHVYLGIDSPDSLWTMSPAAEKLPDGEYIIANSSNLTSDQAYKAMLGWGLGQYRFRFENGTPTSTPDTAARLVVPKEAADRLTEAVNELNATWKIRDLINLPSNLLNTRELADAVKLTAEQFNQQATIRPVTSPYHIRAFPLIDAVGRASSHPPFFTEFAWSGSNADDSASRIMLVGKGVTFDTGGIQVKGHHSMRDMRKDMGGAAHALGLAQMIMSNDLPVHLNVLVPIAENAVSANAYRPNDIITARDGTNVKISHTDAEGRLIMADSLAYGSEKYNPDLIITYATLTGAQRASDGYEVGGVFTPDVALGRDIEDRGMDWSDELQFHRLHEHLHGRKLKDSDGTLKSSPRGTPPGATLAALFLKHFTRSAQNATHIHFDMNGMNVSSKPGKPKGGEAMGVRAMYRHIERMVSP